MRVTDAGIKIKYHRAGRWDRRGRRVSSRSDSHVVNMCRQPSCRTTQVPSSQGLF